MSRKLFSLYFVTFLGVALKGQSAPEPIHTPEPPNPETQKAEKNLDRIQGLVDAGALPKSALDAATAAISDAEDLAILDRTLYGLLNVQDLTEHQADEMLGAARRRVARQQDKVDKGQRLIAAGVAAPNELDAARDELNSRRTTLGLAENRANLLHELAEMVHTEIKAESEPLASPMGGQIVKRYVGSGVFTGADFKKVEIAYTQRFAHPLPISAFGETELHRSLGFDHRGRVDVALNPDQPEGLWLRHYLESAKIPYFAFRSAVTGQATAPHIHLGPPSLRLKPAENVAGNHGFIKASYLPHR